MLLPCCTWISRSWSSKTYFSKAKWVIFIYFVKDSKLPTLQSLLPSALTETAWSVARVNGSKEQKRGIGTVGLYWYLVNVSVAVFNHD